MKPWATIILALIVSLVVSLAVGKTVRETPLRTARRAEATGEPKPPDFSPGSQQLQADLVTVPVIAASSTGAYIADLRKEEFSISEDEVPQTIAVFATASAPFTIVLMLDTSASSEGKLTQIQQAAIAFVDLLNSADRVKVISFDNDVRDLNDFTNEKKVLRDAIKRTRSGTGTRFYDAMQTAIETLRPVKQRKAIVLFTDGVDWHSDNATSDQTLRQVDESEAIIYPIRFDTRVESERIARQQQAQINGPVLPTSDVIRTTPNTFPKDEPTPAGQTRTSPLPSIIFSPAPTSVPTPTRSRGPAPSQFPTPNPVSPPQRNSRTNGPGPVATTTDDSLTAEFDKLYFTADSYLKELAGRTGGHVYRADNVGVLPHVFQAIADELRTQYLIGYYPTNRTGDGGYRKISVKTSRKDITIRARPGYHAKAEE
jgi:Mg-chelatase subunit ChlD